MAHDTDSDPHDPRESGSFSTAATATENTPLLRSETSSSRASSTTLSDAQDDAAATRPPPPPSDPAAPPKPLGWRRGTAVVLSMWVLVFLQAANMSGMTVAQSAIAADLGVVGGAAMWFTSAYMIAVASLAPLVGRLATVFSPGPLVLGTSAFFALGAVVEGRATGFGSFVLGRVLVGVGGGGIMTLSMILVLQLTDRRRRGLFVGLVNTGFTVGVSMGAVVFGALLDVIGWRALFWVQSPIGVVAALGVYFSMPYFPPQSRGAKDKTMWQKLAGIDYAGAIFLTLTIVLFLYGLSGEIQPLPMALSAASLVAFLVIETYLTSDPLIPLAVLRSRGVLLTCLAQQGFMACRWTVLYYAPIFALAVRGLPAAAAGSVLIPTNMGFAAGGLLVGALHVRRAGAFWLPALVSLGLFAASLWAIGRVSTAETRGWVYVAAVFANGLCTGAAINYTLAHLLHLAAPRDHFVATSLLATFRGFAGSFGTAIGGGAFVRSLTRALGEGFARLDGGDGGLSEGRRMLIARLIGSPALVFGTDLSPAEQVVAIQGYEAALRTLYRGAAVVSLVVLLVQAGTGWTAPEEADEEEVREALVEYDGAMEA